MTDTPFTIITLKKTPPSLRGDLSKWMQEIATGVYVGNFNTRIRVKLWERVLDSVGSGEATLSYACQNEIGYNFATHNTARQVIDCEGLPLVLFPIKAPEGDAVRKHGFSDASKFHRARVTQESKSQKKPAKTLSCCVIDLETDGLDPGRDRIIEIAAVKEDPEGVQTFHVLLMHEGCLPQTISELTGISDALLQAEGKPLKESLLKLLDFIGDSVLLGYNINFDMKFLLKAFQSCGLKSPSNKRVDLMYWVKKDKMFLPSYKLEYVLTAYAIEGKQQHRALIDAKLTYELSKKVNKFQQVFGG